MDTTQTRTLANDWLKDFCLALKNVALYSAEHPRGREYVDRAYGSLRRAMGERREVALARSDGRLLLDQVILDRDRGLARQLEEDLASRGVDGITFVSTITPEEHLGLIRALLSKPDRVTEKGGFGQVLLDEGVSSVKPTVERGGRARETGEASLLGEVSLIEFLVQIGRGQGPAHGAGSPAFPVPSVTSMLTRDPEAVARAIQTAARNRDPGAAPPPETIAEIMADTLERLAERAIEEHQRSREEVLADIGRAVVAADPRIHASLFLEKAGSRSIRKNLASAVETLPPDAISELIAIHFPLANGDFRRLTEILGRTLTWKEDRAAVLTSLEARLRAVGMGPDEYQDLIDHLLWGEVPTARRLELLQKGDLLWRVDFTRMKEVLVKLFASDQVKEATALIQKYLSGLMMEDLEIKRLVADNARYILQLIEKMGKGQPMLARISDLFFMRLQDEQDPDVVSRLAGGLAFLADLRLRSGDMAATLDLMRKAENLGASSVPALRERGERLAEALSRAGNDKIFKSLTEMLLTGADQASMEASEILKRGGNRSANYLIERLAEEESRTHRARLVMLLKEMGKGSSVPFVARLEDPRWYLVRNVVGILGDIGDAGVLPELRKVASHPDPRVRREVVRTYTRFVAPECEDLIVEALSDEDRGVQITAVNALAMLKGPKTLGVLTQIARKGGQFQAVAPEVRQEAIASLGRLASGAVFPVLSEIVSRKGFLGHVETTEIRAAAARALGGLKTPEAIAMLTELAQKDPRQPVREAAQEGLQQRAPSITPPR
jgi:hypothetical protein